MHSFGFPNNFVQYCVWQVDCEVGVLAVKVICEWEKCFDLAQVQQTQVLGTETFLLSSLRLNQHG